MIPAQAHFIWFGRAFPWVNVLAIRSAWDRGGFDRVVLHHADDLSETPWWGALTSLAGFEARRLDPEALLRSTGEHGEALAALYRRLTAPAARANMARAAILWHQGGVYLDLDTVTVDTLAPLRAGAQVFCGAERIVFPEWVTTSRDPRVWASAGLRTTARDLLRRVPGGWRGFRRVEWRYPMAVNNAVVGAEPGHPFVADLLGRMVRLPAERQLVRFALGTHLLEQAVRDTREPGLVVHLPGVFYPLGPEISEHWFRPTRRPALGEVLRHETRVVHWYASVRTRDIAPRIDPDYVRRHAGHQLFSALARPFVTE